MDIGFYILTPLAICSACLAISVKSLTRAVLFLCLFFLVMGGLYINLSCEFLGFIQILIYAGGVILLFLFVIMTSGHLEVKSSSPILKCFGLLSSFLLFYLMFLAFRKPLAITKGAFVKTNVGISKIGTLLMTEYLIQFETISILLLVVLIGAIVLLKGE